MLIYFRLKLVFKKLKFKYIKVRKKRSFEKPHRTTNLSKIRLNSLLKLTSLGYFRKLKFFKNKKNLFRSKRELLIWYYNFFFNKFFKKKIFKKIKKKGFLLISKKYLLMIQKLKLKKLKKKMKKRNFKRIKKNTFFKIFKKIVYKRLNKNKILFFSKPKVFPILRYYIRKRLHRKKKKLLLKRCKLRLKIKLFSKRRYNFFFKFRRFKKKKIKKLKRKSYRKLRFFRKRKKFITSNFKVKYYFNNKPKNNIIVLFNIKFVKNLRLFLFYQSYGKFNFKKKFRLVRKRWSYKSPLMRLNFFYKLHMFMKLFRAQMLNYEYIIPIFKEKIMVYLRNIKVLYPLEYVWFKEYNLSRLLIRLHVINSYRLGLV